MNAIALLLTTTLCPADELDVAAVHGDRARGAIIVHLGCGNSHRLMDLHAGGRYVVQALDRDAAKVAAVRKHLQEKGLYGLASARRLSEDRLPYADNLINAIVVDDPLGIAKAEIMRVVTPLGAAWIRDGAAWKKSVKPWPKELDEWTHFLHDAGGNAVSSDTRVGPPRRLQWSAGSLWGRSHEMNNSFPALVTARGRMFYIFDKGVTGMEDKRLPEKWTLTGRDGFNGSLLWERPLPAWGSHVWKTRALRFFGGGVARRLVVDGNRLWCTIEYGGKVHEIDATTGKTLAVIPQTEGAVEILVDGDHVFVGRHLDSRRGQPAWVITCFDRRSSKVLWQARDSKMQAQMLAIAKGEVLYHTGKETVCIDRKSGAVRWRKGEAAKKQAAAPKRRGNRRMLIIADGKVIVSSRKVIVARALADGKEVWRAPGVSGKSMREYDLFHARGHVWCASEGAMIAGYDVKTGKKAKVLDASTVQSHGHHLRCYRAKATENFLITQFRGVEFLSLGDEDHNQNDWLRGTCTYGIMPANGFLYAPPHSCFCFSSALIKGLNAFAGETSRDLSERVERSKPGPIEKGPAFGFIAPAGALEAWPTYRHDARRTGATADAISSQLKRTWKTHLGTGLTPPVAANGRLFVAEKDKHAIHALDAESGRKLWSFTAGARIDSPPTIHRGLLVFGSADGYLYCVRAEDGVQAWRRRLAPMERWLTSQGQLESAWRLHGSVAVERDLAYATAGRSSFLDGGITLYAVDVKSGEIRHQAILNTRTDTREDRQRNEFVAAYHIEGANSDLLTAEGGYVYLSQMKFSPDLKLQRPPYLSKEEVTKRASLNLDDKEYVNEDIFRVRWRNKQWSNYKQLAGILVDENQNLGEQDLGLHLFTTSGFLDTSFFNRTYWMYSKTWTGFNMANLAPKAGQILVIGPDTTYALKAFTSRYALSPKYDPESKGYQLVADKNDNEPTLDPRAWGKDKGMGFSRGAPPVWNTWLTVRVQAMVLAGKTLVACGPPDVLKEGDPEAAFRGRAGSELLALSAGDGKVLSRQSMKETPIFDGMISVDGRLFICTQQGDVVCLKGE